jgi:uncharacterized protein (TIGR02284 family)
MNNVTSRTDVIDVLNNLITICQDGHDGYMEAARGTDVYTYKSLFTDYATQRQRQIADLSDLVVLLGGDPHQSGSVTGGLHRAWLDIRAAVSGRDISAILDECERGEDAAVEAYENALQKPLPANVHATIERQYALVRNAHDHIKQLRDTVQLA